MCGVFAYVGDKEIDVRGCLSRLSHRGPDHTGVLKHGNVTFGHCRLSIIDLDRRSNQPMVSVSGNSSIVFNGEIYNYRTLREELMREDARFATESDTEVILEGYERHGTAFFEKLRGMWGFVIHDRRKNVLVAARDPFGIKPLNYATRGSEIYLFSEIHCLKGVVPLEPDPEAYKIFYNLGYFLAPSTPYKNVSKLRPGEVLSWDINVRKISAVQQVSRFANATPRMNSYDEALNALDSALTDSVEAHYVADVPVSMLLSGGNDSSLVAALSKKLGKTPSAYHVAIAGSEDTRYAESVAKHLGIDLVVRTLDQKTLEQQYEKVWDILDEPTGDISIIPTSLVFERIKGKSKVVLSGEGGDELFGGYVRHALFSSHSKVFASSRSDSFFNMFLSPNASSISAWNPTIQRTRELLLRTRAVNDLIGAYLRGSRLIDYPLDNGAVRVALHNLYRSESAEKIPPPLAFDMLAYLPNDLLPKSDIASMASSIEARVPFLDRPFAAVARDAFKFAPKPLGNKKMLKEVLCRYLPRELVYRGKSGFGVPMHTYDPRRFETDFDKACDFHLQSKDAFGVGDAMVRLIRGRSPRHMIVRKFPRFAFALISNWRHFGV